MTYRPEPPARRPDRDPGAPPHGYGPPPGHGGAPPVGAGYLPPPPQQPGRSGAMTLLVVALVGVAVVAAALIVVPLLLEDDTGTGVEAAATESATPSTAETDPTETASTETASTEETEQPPDGEPASGDPITTVKAWIDAYNSADEAGFLALTCAAPTGQAASRIDAFDGGFVEADGGYGWTEENYMVAGLTDTESKVFAGPVLNNGDGVTPWEVMTLVAEGGEWKVCDSYYPDTEEAQEEQRRIRDGEYDEFN